MTDGHPLLAVATEFESRVAYFVQFLFRQWQKTENSILKCESMS